MLKAELVARIGEIIQERQLNQVEVAKLLGLSQPDVSRLLRGDPHGSLHTCLGEVGRASSKGI